MDRYAAKVIKHTGIAIAIGLGFNIVWAIIFWNSDLFIWHWLSVPLSLAYIIVVAIIDFRGMN